MVFEKNFQKEDERRKELVKRYLLPEKSRTIKNSIGYLLFFIVFFGVTYMSYINFGISSPLVFVIFIIGVALVVVSYESFFNCIGSYNDLYSRMANNRKVKEECIEIRNERIGITRKYQYDGNYSGTYSLLLRKGMFGVIINKDGDTEELFLIPSGCWNAKFTFLKDNLVVDEDIRIQDTVLLPRLSIQEDHICIDEKGYGENYQKLKDSIMELCGDVKISCLDFFWSNEIDKVIDMDVCGNIKKKNKAALEEFEKDYGEYVASVKAVKGNSEEEKEEPSDLETYDYDRSQEVSESDEGSNEESLEAKPVYLDGTEDTQEEGTTEVLEEDSKEESLETKPVYLDGTEDTQEEGTTEVLEEDKKE